MQPSSEVEILPIFPLTGSLLLPGNFLPLNIFETRYCNLVRDAMEGDRQIGMVQPRTPMPDHQGPVREQPRPEIYGVGCVGYIQQYDPQADGRYLIVLRGVRRFRVAEELPPVHGYRRVRPEYGEFGDDEKPLQEGLEPERLLVEVERFGGAHGLEFDRDLLGSLPPVTLVNALAAALPFPAGEKQALLEAPTTRDREEILLELMQMAVGAVSEQELYQPPTVH